ncbi:MAG: type VI secretion system tube protein Hcp [Syntrophobacteraceae bacterium]|jgi:type VI secretion system secreted protein Hcp
MAVNIFLKIEGPTVEGESVVAKHEKEIDIYGWSWGMTQSGSMHVATGGGSGKVSVQDIHISKKVDKSSTVLMKHCSSGQHFDKATLMVYKAGGDQPVEYMKIVMDKVIISSYSTGGNEGDDSINESLSLNFSKYKVTYTPQLATGVKGAEAEHTWDIAKNQP